MTQVTLLVKNVYNGSELELEQLDLNLTVLDVKKKIQTIQQQSQDIEKQRLIYCGKVCANSATLASLLEKMDLSCKQTFHLLVPKSQTPTPPTETVEAPVDTAPAPAATPAPAPEANLRDPVAPPPETVENETPTFQYDPNYLYQYQMMMQQQQLMMQQSFSQFPTNYNNLEAMQQHIMAQAQYNALMTNIQLQYMQHQSSNQDSQQPNPYFFPTAAGIYTNPTFQVHPGVSIPPPNAVGGIQQQQQQQNPPNAAAPEPNNQADNNQGHGRRRFAQFAEFIDVSLAIKLGVMVIIMGQDADAKRLSLFISAAVVCYLYQTGILHAISRRIGLSNRNVGPNAANAAGANPDPDNANAGNGQGPSSSVFSLSSMSISNEEGFFKDVKYFLFGFFLSLVPSWHPSAAPIHRAPEPVHAPAVAEDQNQQPVEAN